MPATSPTLLNVFEYLIYIFAAPSFCPLSISSYLYLSYWNFSLVIRPTTRISVFLSCVWKLFTGINVSMWRSVDVLGCIVDVGMLVRVCLYRDCCERALVGVIVCESPWNLDVEFYGTRLSVCACVRVHRCCLCTLASRCVRLCICTSEILCI